MIQMYFYDIRIIFQSKKFEGHWRKPPEIMAALPATHGPPTLELRHRCSGEPGPARRDARFALRVSPTNVSAEPSLAWACSVSVDRCKWPPTSTTSRRSTPRCW